MTADTGQAAAHEIRPAAIPAILVAGIAGELVLEFIAWVVAPPLLGRPMQPALLVSALSGALLGAEPPLALSFAVHLAAGIVVFPAGYVLFRRVLGIRSAAGAGLTWGVLLWLLAQAALAPLAGRPFMLGFVPYTWASLAAHMAYAGTVALVLQRLTRRPVERS